MAASHRRDGATRGINRPLEKERSVQKEMRFIDRKTHKETEKKNT